MATDNHDTEYKPYQPDEAEYEPYRPTLTISTAQTPTYVIPRKRLPEHSPPDFNEREQDMQDQQDDLLDRLAGHYSPFEGLEFLVKAEKTVWGNVRASFKDGNRLAEVVDEAIRPKIGLTLLAGADTPQVNQMEQISMSGLEPDQRDPSWRVNTAGSLLKSFEVDKSMSIHFTDNTPMVIASARQRMTAPGPFVDPSSPNVQKALTVRLPTDRLVTIDSDNVKIVDHLASDNWDLEGLLVEVDQSSLMAVIFNYRQIIERGGADLPCGETIKLLDQMIEDAHRLCVRSPILFRMGTRRHIMSSKNTRYGYDRGTMFHTLTTSSGIKSIISLSSAYFNSLASYSKEDQQLIRPRFLQMLVLLLSLLNDDDLNELREFLEITYRIRAERQHLELLILKVLPLMSINSKIFLTGLIKACEDPSLTTNPSNHLEDQPVMWQNFLLRLFQKQYILPVTLENVARDDCSSWLSKWPEDGHKDSTIFRHLQYAGQARTFNEIPPIDFHNERTANEVTAVFTNGGRYIVSNADLDNIIRMVPRRFALTEAVPEGRSLDLEISEVNVNEPLYRAIWEINAILVLVKGILPARPKLNMAERLNSIIGGKFGLSRRSSSGSKSSQAAPPGEIKASGRLTYHVALLNGKLLAVAYKVEGRKITRRQLIRYLASDLSMMKATMDAIETTIQQTFEEKRMDNKQRMTIDKFRQSLGAVMRLYRSAEENKEKMERHSARLSDEPVSKVLYPIGSDETPKGIWNDYTAWYSGIDNVLYIDSFRRFVKTVVWNTESVMEVTFHNREEKYFLTPLRKVQQDEQGEELRANDSVILAGQYLIVVEQSGQSFTPNSDADARHSSRAIGNGSGGGNERPRIPLESVVNWLKITGVEIPRRRNRRHPVPETSLLIRSPIR